MVVPIYKQWTANTIRIQVVVQDNIIQLLAFFEDFSHADAMNFQLKSMDVFEKTDKGGKACVRLVDAKFALPVEERRGEGKMGKEEGKISGWAGMKRRFVCLDQIEYPGEHDDILIAFETAESRLNSYYVHIWIVALTLLCSARSFRRCTPGCGAGRAQVHCETEDLVARPLAVVFTPFRPSLIIRLWLSVWDGVCYDTTRLAHPGPGSLDLFYLYMLPSTRRRLRNTPETRAYLLFFLPSHSSLLVLDSASLYIPFVGGPPYPCLTA